MTKLNFIDKDNIERIFGMEYGYVLDFSNRTFQEFIYDILNIDIYEKYDGLSKAKILRAIINEYDKIYVGKVILALLRYMQSREMIAEENKALFIKAVEIGNKLIGKSSVIVKQANISKSVNPIKNIVDYDSFIDKLNLLSKSEETPQNRGYEFEKYLNNLFKEFQLDPRGSFKIVGEQIDGSFILHNEVYLLEAKWTSKPIDKSELVVFNEKVSSKSGFTRGLFISYSGYSEEAIKTLSNGRTINIILMTVAEIASALCQKEDLSDVIFDKVRYLAEEGKFNKITG